MEERVESDLLGEAGRTSTNPRAAYAGHGAGGGLIPVAAQGLPSCTASGSFSQLHTANSVYAHNPLSGAYYPRPRLLSRSSSLLALPICGSGVRHTLWAVLARPLRLLPLFPRWTYHRYGSPRTSPWWPQSHAPSALGRERLLWAEHAATHTDALPSLSQVPWFRVAAAVLLVAATWAACGTAAVAIAMGSVSAYPLIVCCRWDLAGWHPGREKARSGLGVMDHNSEAVGQD